MRIAFKEWAVVIDALARGEQILILRKGGISERTGGFQLDHERFLLFPTLFHQQRQFVAPSAQARYDLLAATLSPSVIRLECFAEVVNWKLIDNFAAAMRLQGQHIWRDESIRDKFETSEGRSVYAMAVRVYRLPLPVELPMEPHYGGCKSWVELDTIISRDNAQPVLTDREFSAKLERFEQALETAEV